jgi:hypothetical protein
VRPRAGEGAAQLGAEGRRPAALRQLPVEPAVAPVDQPEAVPLAVGARRLHQALAPAALAAPDPGQGGVQGHLHLVLQVQVGAGQQAQQALQVGRDEVGQGRVRHQVFDGWRQR